MSDHIGSGFAESAGNSCAIAVIGMAARVPGADGIEAFWENLALGVESVTWLDEATLLARGVSPARLADENYVRAAPMVEHVEDFDAGFFKLAPREAAAMDPQIRLFLEIAHATLENAGYDPVRMNRDVGVIAAVGPSRYATLHLAEDIELAGGAALGQHSLTHADYVATTVSYRLDLHGPSMTVLTACSGSLAALHVGCQMLQSGECAAVIVGGSNVEFPIGSGYAWTPGGILSAEGRCRPFDAKAAGTLFGSGAAAVLLKPLDEAIADGDRVEAVVLGTAMNNDGADKVSFSAPSRTGQVAVIMEAMSLAGVTPEEIGYVEAHGTGTPVGDPLEVAALTEAYAALAVDPARPAPCGIGSVKGNIGHLGPAAGIIGFIKPVLALHREQLPPTINLEVPNPAIGFTAGPFDPVRELRGWPRDPGRPRRAAVSSLGIGGSNVHVVLGEAPETAMTSMPQGPRLLIWSGRDETIRDAAAARLADWLVQAGDAELTDAAATLQHGRTAHQVRGAVIVGSVLDAVRGLGDPARVVTKAAPARLPELAVNDTARFAELARRLPAFESELRGVLAGSGDIAAEALRAWSMATTSGDPGTDAVLAVAVRVALARVWIAAGAGGPAAIADPAGLPGVLGCLGGGTDVTAVAARLGGLPSGSPDVDLWPAHLAAVALFWVGGASLAWESLGLPSPGRRAALPSYPYARSRHWVDPPGVRARQAPAFWSPGWRDASAEVRAPAPQTDAPVLVLAPAARDAVRPLMVALRAAGADVVRLEPAADFAASGEDLVGRADDPEQLAKAIDSISGRGQSSVVIVHALGLAALDAPEDRRRALDAIGAIARLGSTSTAVRPVVVVSGSADVSGAELVAGSAAELALRSLADLPDCHWIDLGPQVIPEVLGAAVLDAPPSDRPGHMATALRGRRRWVPERLPMREPDRVADPRGLAGRGRPFLVIDDGGEFAVRFTEALAAVGVPAGVVAVTPVDSAARAGLLAAADAGTAVRLLDWSGRPADLAEALRPVDRIPICAVLVAAAGNTSVRATVEAVGARLSARPLDAAVAVLIAGAGDLTAARALAWGQSASLDILGAERSLTVTGTAATLGATVLELLASGHVGDVASPA
jgi:acyl transferase domain-containing protein